MSRTPLTIKEFGTLFKVLIDINDLKITEVCDLCGINWQYPSLWRKGEGRKPDFQQIGKASEVLGVPVDVLIFGPSEQVSVDRSKIEQLETDKFNLIYAISQQKARQKQKDNPENRTN
jgi:hypothetical protein